MHQWIRRGGSTQPLAGAVGGPGRRTGVLELGGAHVGWVREEEKVVFGPIDNRFLTSLGWAATTGGSRLFCIYIYIYIYIYHVK
jgi:hypothetical protein